MLSVAALGLALVSDATAQSIYRPPLFDHVLPTTAAGKAIESLSLAATPGEYEPTTFAIRADGEPLENVTASVSDLAGPSVIGPDNIDIRVVKVWKQAGFTHKADIEGGVLVPEPLVYDDAESLKGSFKGSAGSSAKDSARSSARGSGRSSSGRRSGRSSGRESARSSAYVPPTISQILRTDIPANTSKQFWITVHVPETAVAGTYTGALTIKTPSQAIATLPLELEVLPFTLLEPRQTYSTSHLMDINNPFVREELADIRRHGFKAMNLWVSGKSPENVRQQLALLEEAGFEDPIALHGKDRENAALAKALQASKFNGYLQGQGEPSVLDAETMRHSIRHHIRESYNIHQLGVRVGVPVGRNVVEMLVDPQSRAYDQVDPLTGKTFRTLGITDEIPEYPQYGIGQDHRKKRNEPFHAYIRGLRQGTVEKSSAMHEVMYWQAWRERPLVNRMLGGVYLWNSRLDGVSAVSYQGAIGGSYGDPNDDFDSRSSRGGGTRDNTLTYVSAQGPIPTLQWEALREAYDDVRYLTTLYAALDELKKSDPAQARQIERQVDKHLEKYQDARDHVDFTGRDYEDTRALLVAKIKEAL